jgi:hypothetical protein
MKSIFNANRIATSLVSLAFTAALLLAMSQRLILSDISLALSFATMIYLYRKKRIRITKMEEQPEHK